MVTVREIAEHAGVSIGTVSRVLNSKPGVSDARRTQILAIIRETGYVPPQGTTPNRTKVTHVGILIRPTGQALMQDIFYGDVFRGTEYFCSELQINISFSILDILNGQMRTLPAMVGDERISGIVLVGALPREIVNTLAETARVPIVLVDNCYPDWAWDSVMTDNLRGGYLATQHLISAGHRQITLLGGPEHPSIIERAEGYKLALQEHGLNPLVVKTPDLAIEDGKMGLLELLHKAPQTTGIFCSNDNQAIGAQMQLQNLGFRVPEDFSIVGFDDIHTVNFTAPPITTIRIDRIALGQLAAQLLLGRINNPDRAIIKTIVGVQLIQRSSVCKPRPISIKVVNIEV